MLLEFLAENIPHTKALMLFDPLGELNEQKILPNLNINDYEIIQHIIENSSSLIKLVADQKSFGLSEINLVLLENNIVGIRRLEQDRILVLLLSSLITQESEVLQFNNFVN